MHIHTTKKVTLSEHGATVLGQHALSLQASDPARAQIELLLARYSKAQAITPLELVRAAA